MGWDYDKLFQEGNLIGFYVSLTGENIAKVIDGKEARILQGCYRNELLSYPNYNSENYRTKIQYIVQIDEKGNVIERLFDRDRDMVEYPELNVGTFGKIMYFNGKSFEDVYRTFGEFVIAKNGYISYKNGGYDHVNDIISFKNDDVGVKLVEVYDANFFNQCNDTNLIWRNPMYEKWLKEKEEK